MEQLKQSSHASSLIKNAIRQSLRSLDNNEETQSPFRLEMSRRQEPLISLYRKTPSEAWVSDDAVAGTGTDLLADPLHSNVCAAGFDIPVSVHKAVGGESDAPCPGEILSAALAACLESTIRVIANRLNIELTVLSVTAKSKADVRGTLRMDRAVPIGFQKMSVDVDIAVVDGTSDALFSALLKAAETSCVVMQTLRQPPSIDLSISRHFTDRSVGEDSNV